MIYIIPYFTFLILSLMELVTRNRYTYVSFFLIISLFFIAIFRFDTGTDYLNYLAFWNHGSYELSIIHGEYAYIDVGLKFMINVLHYITDSDFIYFSVLAGIPLLFFYKTLLDWNYYLVIPLFIYFTFFYFAYLFNGMAQAFTISLSLYSIKYIVERRILPVLLLTLFASAFHLSGIAIILFYLIMMLRLSATKCFIMAIILGALLRRLDISFHALFFVFPSSLASYELPQGTPLFDLVTKLIIFSSFFVFTFLIKNYSQKAKNFLPCYFYQKNQSLLTPSKNACYRLTFLEIAKYEPLDLYTSIFRAYSLGILIFLSLSNYDTFATRVFMIFKPLEILMLSLMLSNLKNTLNRGGILSLFFNTLFVAIRCYYKESTLYISFSMVLKVRRYVVLIIILSKNWTGE